MTPASALMVRSRSSNCAGMCRSDDSPPSRYGPLSASTTIDRGAYGGGTVFELTPKTGGGWKETVLHNFANKGKGGNGAAAPLIFDAAGNLYSTTVQGGAVRSFNGTVFELTPNGSGGWTEIVLYAFRGGNDGIEPYAGLVRDRSGNLYGATIYGGANDGGTLFEVTP